MCRCWPSGSSLAARKTLRTHSNKSYTTRRTRWSTRLCRNRKGQRLWRFNWPKTTPSPKYQSGKPTTTPTSGSCSGWRSRSDSAVCSFSWHWMVHVRYQRLWGTSRTGAMTRGGLTFILRCCRRLLLLVLVLDHSLAATVSSIVAQGRHLSILIHLA